MCLCVRDRCGRGRNEFAGRVQNNHLRFSFHRNGHIIILCTNSKSCCRSGHSALQATRRIPLWALAIALSTGKNTRLFVGLDQNKTRFDFSLTCHSVQKARQKLSRRAISRGSFTVAGDFVLQLICLESLGSELQQSELQQS